MPNTYLSLDEFKATAVGMGLNIASTAGDTRLLTVLEGVSREIDRYCNRHFYTVAGTMLYSGNGGSTLIVNDLISVASIEEDSNGDGTFDTTWNGTDYYLAPYNANPTAEYGRPYNHIQLNRNSNGSQEAFIHGQRNYRITGTWGYISVTEQVGTLAGSIDATATTLSFGTSATIGTYETGWTIVIGTEQMYVKGEAGTSVTVQRGMNMTTATAHGSDTAISRHIYPAPISEAVAMQASRLYKRSQVQYATELGAPEAGQFVRVSRGFDSDVKEMLYPYRRIPLGGL